MACVGEDPVTSSTLPPGSSGDDGGATALGAACDAASPCTTGVCVDGVCCESACDGVCEACDAAGKCVPVTGAPKHGKCDGEASGPCAGSCDGTQRDACAYPEVECGAASCAAGTAALAPRCKAGTCPAPTTQKCALGCFEEGCLGVQQVAGGYYHTCALLTDGKVRCWGANDAGESGQGAAGTGAEDAVIDQYS